MGKWKIRNRGMAAVMSLSILTAVSGCANGAIYWTKPDATDAAFQTDHQPCLAAAYVGYGAGNEQAYKGCMRSKGWTRVQGTGSQFPNVPHFRGPEGDDEFAAPSMPAGPLRESGANAALCERAQGYRPLGVACK
jgi:hypothetical protein